ncbi:lactate dehydrogenase [Pseudomonas abieticivorans]|uniref:lactate dehydrogenase n=1 Tax=Pseudomonas abieticivorans TaxID=2931382 RepID=UPI0020BF29E0|nr:lactate dehydrogenase [Pseudomonas sp. PIA16]
MTSITASLVTPQLNLASLATSLPPAQTVTAQAAAVSAPAAIVTLGQATSSDTQVYSMRGVLTDAEPVSAWENSTAKDAVTSTLSNNFGSVDSASRFKNLGAALLTQLAKGGGSHYSQSVINSSKTTAAAQLASAQKSLHASTDNSISLTLTTASGKTITLSLASQANGLAVQMDVTGGDLSDTELAAVGKLADGFQSAIDGLTQVPPRLNLDGLSQFDKSVFTSVDLTSQLQVSDADVQTLSFHADADKQSVKASGPSGDVQLTVDTRNAAILGTAQQQAQALNAFLAQFDAAGKRGKGDADLMNLFKDAFTSLNGPSATASTSANSATPLDLNDTEHAMLTGLADFTASIKQTDASPNPMRSGETDSFEYTASQKTDVQGNPLDRSIAQQQQSHLKASYHKSLFPGTALALGNLNKDQNYYYYQLDDSASSTASIAYQKGELVDATLKQDASQTTKVSKYVMGKLEETTVTPKEVSKSQSYLQVIEAAVKQDQKAGLGSEGFRTQAAIAKAHDQVLQALNPYDNHAR